MTTPPRCFLEPLDEDPDPLLHRRGLHVHAHLLRRHLVVEGILEHHVHRALRDTLLEPPLGLVPLGTGRDVVEEVLADHLARRPAGHRGFAGVELEDLAGTIDQDRAEWQTIETRRVLGDQVVDVVAAKRDQFHQFVRRFVAGVGARSTAIVTAMRRAGTGVRRSDCDSGEPRRRPSASARRRAGRSRRR